MINALKIDKDTQQQLDNIAPSEIDEIKRNIMQEKGVKEFLKEYNNVLTPLQIERGISAFIEYTVFLNDPVYMPRLRIANGLINCVMEQRPEALEQMTKAKWKMRLDLSRVSKENKRATFKEYDMTEMGRQLAFSALYDVVKNYDENKKNVGVWLVGAMGIGKSYLMAAVAKELNAKGAGVTMISTTEMVEEIKAQWVKDSDNKEKVLNKLKFVDVLIIDDIGAESVTSFYVNDVLAPLVDWRYKHEKLTFFTSNLTKNDYAKLLAKPKNSNLTDLENTTNMKRIMTRIDGLVKEVQVTGTNRRESY